MTATSLQRRLLRNVSVRAKLKLIVMLTSGVALALACSAFLAYDNLATRNAATRNLGVLAAVIARESNASVAFRDAEVAGEILGSLSAEPQILAAAIYLENGKELARYRREGSGSAIPPAPAADGIRFEGNDLVLFTPVRQEKERIGTVYVISDLHELHDHVWLNARIAIVVLLGSILLAWLLASRLERVITGPVLHLAETVRKVSAEKTYSIRAAKEGNDELGVLIDGFNEMLSQIQARDEALQRGHDELERRVAERTHELKLKDEQLRQSQKMEAIGSLAGGVAHDFNNLLSAIIGFCELAQTELPPDCPQRRYLEEISKAGDRAAALTRQLLAFSRKQVLQAEILDLNALVADMDKMLRRIIGEHITLDQTLDQGLGRVKADRGQIEQVLMNLVINSRDAMPRGGRLTIETANVELNAAYSQRGETITQGPAVMIAVTDTGVGMDTAILSHIFEPFYTTKERGRGTGLGLSTVYGIVKQSGGYIWVQSTPQRGTTIRIYLPRVEGATKVKSAVRRAPAVARGEETVLLVEDEERVRALVRQVLTMNGYSVLEASNGNDGIEIIRRHPGSINLLLTDVIMPGMGGRELVEKAVPLRPDMRVMYMSGYTDDQIVHTGVLDQRIPFLQKPFSPDLLASKVRDALDCAAVAGV